MKKELLLFGLMLIYSAQVFCSRGPTNKHLANFFATYSMPATYSEEFKTFSPKNRHALQGGHALLEWPSKSDEFDEVSIAVRQQDTKRGAAIRAQQAENKREFQAVRTALPQEMEKGIAQRQVDADVEHLILIEEHANQNSERDDEGQSNGATITPAVHNTSFLHPKVVATQSKVTPAAQTSSPTKNHVFMPALAIATIITAAYFGYQYLGTMTEKELHNCIEKVIEQNSDLVILAQAGDQQAFANLIELCMQVTDNKTDQVKVHATLTKLLQ